MTSKLIQKSQPCIECPPELFWCLGLAHPATCGSQMLLQWRMDVAELTTVFRTRGRRNKELLIHVKVISSVVCILDTFLANVEKNFGSNISYLIMMEIDSVLFNTKLILQTEQDCIYCTSDICVSCILTCDLLSRLKYLRGSELTEALENPNKKGYIFLYYSIQTDGYKWKYECGKEMLRPWKENKWVFWEVALR